MSTYKFESDNLWYAFGSYKDLRPKLLTDSDWEKESNSICRAITDFKDTAAIPQLILIYEHTPKDELIAGCILSQRSDPKLGEDGEYYCAKEKLCWYIDFFCIKERYRRKRLGKRIIQVITNEIIPLIIKNTDIKEITLMPVEGTDKFYEGCGFENYDGLFRMPIASLKSRSRSLSR